MKTFLRRLEILNYLKDKPSPLGTEQILNHLVSGGYLEDEGYRPQSQLRIVQRDLKFLLGPLDEDDESGDGVKSYSNDFGLLMVRGAGKSLHWKLDPYQKLSYDFEKMPTYMALAFSLVKKHLGQVLPRNTLAELEKFFAIAENKLHIIDGHESAQHVSPKSYERLKQSVEFFQRGQSLQPPSLDMDILNEIYRAILNQKQITFCYRGKDYRIHPHGVVIMLPKIYLLALKEEDATIVPIDHPESKLRSFLVHQISDIFVLPQQAITIPEFDLKSYLLNGNMDVLIDSSDTRTYTIKLRLFAVQSSNLISDLTQNPIAPDQKLVREMSDDNDKDNDESFILQARVKRTIQLRNWLLGLGDAAEVLEPKRLRDDMVRALKSIMNRYEQ